MIEKQRRTGIQEPRDEAVLFWEWKQKRKGMAGVKTAST
jgi:hypothetical protein